METHKTTKKTILFIIPLLFVIQVKTQNFDIKITQRVNRIESHSVSRFISKSDEILSIAVPVGLIGYGLLTDKNADIYNGISSGLAIGLSATIMWGAKQIIKRERPFIAHPDNISNYAKKEVKGYSFPSGHTSTAFALATGLTLAYPKWYVAVPSYFFAASVAYSRMNLGVHYFCDVLAGSLLGAGCAYLAYITTKHINNRYDKPNSNPLNIACTGCFMTIAIPF